MEEYKLGVPEYSALLDEDSISSISERYGFNDKLAIEKFIMDFEVHSHIVQRADCITRGGMCMPFYTADGAAKRLSVDVDLLTGLTVDEIRGVMEDTGGTVFRITCDEYVPRNPYPLGNLITYKIYYDSCLGGKRYVKADFFCDADVRPDSELKKSGFELFGFKTAHDMRILSRGSLLGDKITTLALGTIGLRPTSRRTEIAKQVYDLGHLLKSATRRDLEVSLGAFESMTGLKTRHFACEPRYGIPDIIENIEDSVLGLLSLESVVGITAEQTKRYNDFQGTYLSKTHRYKKTEHVTDVLLLCVYSMHVRKYLGGETAKSEAARMLHDILEQVRRIQGDDVPDPESRAASYIRDIPDSIGFGKKMLRRARLEHVFLIRELFSGSS